MSTVLLLAPSASAEHATPQLARLLLSAGCPEQPFEEADLVSTLRVELLGLGTELRHAGQEVEFGEEVVLTIETPTCTGAGTIIRVESPLTGRRQERRLVIDDRPRSERSRILALAMAELLGEVWLDIIAADVEVESIEPPPREDAPAQQEPSELEAPVDIDAIRRSAVDAALREIERREEDASRDVHRVMLDASVIVRSFPTVQGGQLGGQLGVSVLLSRTVPVRLVADIGYGYGGGTADIGDVRVQTVLGGIGVMFSSRSSHVRGVIGPRLELGWGWAEGQAAAPDIEVGVVDAFLLSLAVAGGGRFRLSSRLWITFEGQLGWYISALEPQVDGRSMGGVARVLVSLAIGISVGL